MSYRGKGFRYHVIYVFKIVVHVEFRVGCKHMTYMISKYHVVYLERDEHFVEASIKGKKRRISKE